MSGQAIEVKLQSIAGEVKKAARLQHLAQVMDDRVSQIHAAWSQLQHGHQLAGSFDHSPYPHYLTSLAHLGPQLIQLEVVEEVAVHFASLQSCPGQPGTQGPFSDSKHTLQGRHIHSLCHQGQDQSHPSGGGLQAIEGDSPPPTDLSTAGLATQILDPVGLAVPAVSNQGVDTVGHDAIVPTGLVWAGIALGGEGFISSAGAFHIRPGLERLLGLRIIAFIFLGFAQGIIIGCFGF
jgi:hypothetical protein